MARSNKTSSKPVANTTKDTVRPEKRVTYIGKYEHIVGKPYTEDEVKCLADLLYEWFQDPNNYAIMDWMVQPTLMLNYPRMMDFCKRNPYFNEIYSQCKQIQTIRLRKLMIASDKPTAYIFAMKNMSNWRDNPETMQDDDNSDSSLTFDNWGKSDK